MQACSQPKPNCIRRLQAYFGAFETTVVPAVARGTRSFQSRGALGPISAGTPSGTALLLGEATQAGAYGELVDRLAAFMKPRVAPCAAMAALRQ